MKHLTYCLLSLISLNVLAFTPGTNTYWSFCSIPLTNNECQIPNVEGDYFNRSFTSPLEAFQYLDEKVYFNELPIVDHYYRYQVQWDSNHNPYPLPPDNNLVGLLAEYQLVSNDGTISQGGIRQLVVYKHSPNCTSFESCHYEPLDEGDKECDSGKFVGNPINVSSGTKYQKETDYISSKRDSDLRFVRYYQTKVNSGKYVGASWSHNFNRNIALAPAYPSTDIFDFDYFDNGGLSEGQALYQDQLGNKVLFDTVDGELRSYSEAGHVITIQRNPDDSIDLIRLRKKNGDTEEFNNEGILSKIITTNGFTYSLEHSASETLVTTASGEWLRIVKGENGPSSLVTPDLTIGYTYTDIGMLETVTYAPGTESESTLTYLYEHDQYGDLLTGTIDERHRRYNTWSYDANGLVTYSGLGSADVNGNRKEEFSVNPLNAFTTSVDNPYGKESEHHFETIRGARKLTRIEGKASSNCLPSDGYLSYDALGQKDKVTDARGYVTDYDINDQGFLEQKIEGLTWLDPQTRTQTTVTPETRTTTYTWIQETRQVDVVTTENLIIDYDYYPTTHRLQKITQTDRTAYTNALGVTTSQTRVWNYAYNYHNSAELPVDVIVNTMTIDGPLPGTDDSVIYQWDIDGNLTSITNEESHLTQFSDHNGRGQPQTITDPNNIITRITYHPRGWVETITVEDPDRVTAEDSTTAFAWYENGTLQRITQPDGSYLHYEYNDARHLTEISNNLGEVITFTPDEMGNWTLAETKDVSTTIQRQQQHAFDELGRLMDVLGNYQQHTHYDYDESNNLNGIEEQGATRLLTTTLNYDALDRLAEEIRPINYLVNGVETSADVKTTYTYDASNKLTSVTDPENKVTTYWNNGFGERIRTISPDTQTTDAWFNEQGNLTDKIDARGVRSTYHYDDLGRLTHIEYPANTSLDVRYFYDEVTTNNPYARGQLTRMTDPSGSTTLIYDHRGNLVEETRVIDGDSNTVKYVYNLANKLTQITYPSDRIVNYERNDALGRTTRVTTQKTANDTEVVLASNLNYLPFGPTSSVTLGNNLIQQTPYDLDYRLDKILTGSVFDLNIDYDRFNNVNALTNSIRPSRSQTFVYDDLHRLQDAYGSYTNGIDHIHYEFDLLGNRQLVRSSANSTTVYEDTYAYYPDTHRLSGITRTTSSDTQSRSFGYDNAGNLLTETTFAGDQRSYTHAENARLIQLSENTSVLGDYVHNGLGQRAFKTVGSETHRFHFGLNGELLAEKGFDADILGREYVYLHGRLLAVMDTCEEGVCTTPSAAPQAKSAKASPQKSSSSSESSSGDLMVMGGSTGIVWLMALLTLGIIRKNFSWTRLNIKALSIPLLAVFVSACGGTNTETVIYFAHNDHLGTTKVLTNDAGTPVWEGHADPFGETEITIADVEFNQRFPGQYYDSESGIHYNYYRDYDPSLGRYIQSDPIGLAGGSNTFAYANQNPVAYTDEQGLYANIVVGTGIRIVGGRAGGQAVSRGLRKAIGPVGGTIAACLLTGYCSTEGENENSASNPSSAMGSSTGDPGCDPDDPLCLNEGPSSQECPIVNKAVNSNLPHAAERAVERGIYPTQSAAREGLKSLSKDITKNKSFPAGSIVDPTNPTRVLAPVGNGGRAVYHVASNGTAKLKTVLISR
ncbi:MAG: DUF6531 domain-containing protein [Pseudomonadales bacterium]|nr:DUF6531 domain-containing protein [Pseudomonadales bacterium]